MAFDSSDNLYQGNNAAPFELHTINSATGMSTGSIPLSQDILNTLEFDANDVLYGWAGGGGGAELTSDPLALIDAGQLAVIDTGTGNVTYLGGGGPRLTALAAIPEPASLTLLSLGLLGLVALRLRKHGSSGFRVG